MIEPVDELAPELAELIAAERETPVPLERAIVRAGLAVSIGRAPLGHAGVIGKMLVVLAVIAGTGIALRAILADGEADPAAPTEHTASQPRPLDHELRPTDDGPRPRQSSERAADAPLPTLPPAPIVTPPVTPRSRPPRVESAPREPDANSPSQLELLRAGWSAVGPDPARALAIAERDLVLHPDGALREERDALAIEALAGVGRRGDARTAAQAFFTRYPRSVHRAHLHHLLEESP